MTHRRQKSFVITSRDGSKRIQTRTASGGFRNTPIKSSSTPKSSGLRKRGPSPRSRRSSGGGTRISVVSDAPEDKGKLFGNIKIQTPKQFTTSRSRRRSSGGGSSNFIGPVKLNSIFKKPLVSEDPKLSIARAKFNLAISPDSKQKQFLQSIIRQDRGKDIFKKPLVSESPAITRQRKTASSFFTPQASSSKLFPRLVSGDVILKRTKSVIPEKRTRGSDIINILKGPKSLFQTPSQLINKPLIPSLTKKIDVSGTKITGKQTKDIFQIVPKNQRSIRERNINLITSSKSLPGLLVGKQKFTPSREAELKGLAEFENTKLKQNQISKQIKEFNKLPATQQSSSEIKKLNQQKTDIDSRFRLNPFVTEDNGKFKFTGISPTVLASSTFTTKAPDSFIRDKSLFEKGFIAARTGKTLDDKLKGQGFLKNLEFGVGAGAGGLADVLTFNTGRTGKNIEQTLGLLGASPEFSKFGGEKISTTASIAPIFVGGGFTVGGKIAGATFRTLGIGSKATKAGQIGANILSKLPGGKSSIELSKKLFNKATVDKGLLALGIGIAGKDIQTSVQASPTIKEIPLFLGAQTLETGAEFAAFGDLVKGFKSGSIKNLKETKIPSKSEIKSKEKAGTELIVQSKKIKSGEGVTITTTGGRDIVIEVPKQNIFATRSESLGVVKIGDKEFPVRISTTSTGSRIVTAGKDTNIINLPNGEIKVEFPGTNKKPEFFKTNTELSTQSNNIIKGVTITTDKKGAKTLTKTFTKSVPKDSFGQFTGRGQDIVKKSSLFSETQGTTEKIDTSILPGKRKSITDIFRSKGSTTQGQFGPARISEGQFKSTSIKVSDQRVVESPIVEARNKLLKKLGLFKEQPKDIIVPETSFRPTEPKFTEQIKFTEPIIVPKTSFRPTKPKFTEQIKFKDSRQVRIQKQVPKSEQISGQQQAKELIQKQESGRLQKEGQKLQQQSQELKIKRQEGIKQQFKDISLNIQRGTGLNILKSGLQSQFKQKVGLQEQVQKPLQEQIRTQVQEQVQTPVREQIKEPFQRPIQEQLQRPIQEPIQTPLEDVIQEPVKTPIQEQFNKFPGEKFPEGKRPVLPPLGLPPGLSFGNGFNQFGQSRTLLGLKSNPIGTITKTFGVNIRK